jgi:SAM-dependent methyltransferase
MSETTRFDYDEGEIHRTYASGRVLSAAQRRLWSDLVRQEAGSGAPTRVLDLGCGVGRFSSLLHSALGAPVLGIDRSARMLATAAADPDARGVRWVHAAAEALPLRPRSVGFVLMFLVYHHLGNRPAVLRECARVLADGAPLVIVTSTVETLDGQTWLPFFPSARAIDLARVPARADLMSAALDAGLAARHRVVLNPVAAGLRAYAERVASRTISTLQMVPDEEFARGIDAFRRHCAKADDGRPVQDEIDVFTLRRLID